MDITRLQELVKMQKKAETSKSVKREFYDLWLQLIRENGPGEDAFRYLIEGFPFCGMEPFAEYLRSSEDMQKTVIAFMHSSAFGKNAAVSFKCGLHLLACLIRDVEIEFSTCAVIMRELPRLAFTKEKQLIKDLGKIFARHLFSVIYAKKRLPSLGNYGLNQKDLDRFVFVVRNGLDQCRGLQLNENERMGARLTLSWIDEGETEPVQPVVKQENPPQKPVPVVPGPVIQIKQPVQVPAEESQEWSDLYSRGFQNIKAAFEKVQQEMLAQSSETRRLNAEKESIRAELLKRTAETERLKAELREKEEMLFAESKEKELLQNEISWLQAALEKKKDELNDRIQMNQIVQMDNERQNDQLMKRLGSELSTYYQDILESEGAPMSVELGEILRDQIRDVFRVLVKHGIHMEQK